MPRVTHFDISADQPEQLIPFYEDIFGWKFQKWEGPMQYWMVTTGPDDKPGINGGLSKRQADNYVVNTIEVDNIDALLEKIKAQSGKVVMEKAPIPGVGWFAQIEDPETNRLGLMQSDEGAK